MKVYCCAIALIGAAILLGSPNTAVCIELLANGDFEYDPFDVGWSNGLSALEQVPGLNGSDSAVYVDNENATGSFSQEVSSGPQWVFEMSFAAADHATGRSLNLGLVHPGGYGINLRTIGDDLEIYTGVLWKTMFWGAITPSIDADADNDFTSPGDTLNVHRLRVEGHYDVATPYYDVFLSNAGSSDVNDNVYTNVQYWQGPAPVVGLGLSSVALFATTAAGGDYAVDDLSLDAEPAVMPTLLNGDFEAAPFDAGWSNGAGVLQQVPGLDGSNSAAYVDNENKTGTFQQFISSGSEWVVELSFAAADHATGRSLNLGLTHPDALGINLRTIGNDLEVYGEGAGWQTLLADVIGFSVDADGDNDFTSDGDTLAVHHLRIEGHYGSDTPYYDIFLSDADSTDVNDNVVSNVQYWQTAAPDTGDGLTSIAFYATGAAGGDYAIDNITLSYAPPLPGDANDDGKVDSADAAILADHWQQQVGATWADGDFNDDGKVNDIDATILAANWQVGAGTASVPEPSLLALVGGAIVALWLRRR